MMRVDEVSALMFFARAKTYQCDTLRQQLKCIDYRIKRNLRWCMLRPYDSDHFPFRPSQS
jgi:hypothetical protein